MPESIVSRFRFALARSSHLSCLIYPIFVQFRKARGFCQKVGRVPCPQMSRRRTRCLISKLFRRHNSSSRVPVSYQLMDRIVLDSSGKVCLCTRLKPGCRSRTDGHRDVCPSFRHMSIASKRVAGDRMIGMPLERHSPIHIAPNHIARQGTSAEPLRILRDNSLPRT